MNPFIDNFEKFAQFQGPSLEPVRQLTEVAVDTFEKIARQNYAFFGGVLELAVSEAKLPVAATEPKELFDRQVALNQAFAELLGAQVREYAELGKDFQATATTLFTNDIVEPVKKAAKKAA